MPAWTLTAIGVPLLLHWSPAIQNARDKFRFLGPKRSAVAKRSCNIIIMINWTQQKSETKSICTYCRATLEPSIITIRFSNKSGRSANNFSSASLLIGSFGNGFSKAIGFNLMSSIGNGAGKFAVVVGSKRFISSDCNLFSMTFSKFREKRRYGMCRFLVIWNLNEIIVRFGSYEKY